MLEHNALAYLVQHPSMFLTSAVMGVGVNFISYFMIQYTSSLTMKILITVRNMIMVVVSVLFFHEIVTLNQAVGYLIALLGFAGYNLSKMGFFQDWTYGDVYHHNWMPSIVRQCLPLPAKPEGEKGFLLLSTEEI
jgi:drug/metabolite transporter (DMT)-like permease